jgi:hypothetical protein
MCTPPPPHQPPKIIKERTSKIHDPKVGTGEMSPAPSGWTTWKFSPTNLHLRRLATPPNAWVHQLEANSHLKTCTGKRFCTGENPVRVRLTLPVPVLSINIPLPCLHSSHLWSQKVEPQTLPEVESKDYAVIGITSSRSSLSKPHSNTDTRDLSLFCSIRALKIGVYLSLSSGFGTCPTQGSSLAQQNL